MSETVRKVDYFYTTVDDRAGAGLKLLAWLKDKGINLQAFTAFPAGEGKSQLDLVPEDADRLQKEAKGSGIVLVGPKRAFLVQGDDRVGAVVELHQRLADGGISVHAGNAVSDGRGGFGYLLWVKAGDYQEAARLIGA